MENQKIDFYKEYKFLLTLVSSVINNKQIEKAPDHINWQVLYKIALECKLQAYLYYGVLKIKDFELEKKVNESYFVILQNAIERVERQNKLINDLREICNNNEIKYILLKGSQAKKYYPQDELRYMTDVDILIEEKSVELMHQKLIENGYKLTEESECEKTYINKYNVYVEVHKRIFAYSNKNNFLFDNVWEKAIKTKDYKFEFEMDIKHLYLYLMLHCLKHFCVGGFSARMILDFYVLNKFAISKDERKELESIFKQIEIYNFALKIENISNKWYAKLDGLEETQLEKYIISNESIGTYNNAMLVLAINSQNKKGKTSKANYILNIVFPKYEKLAGKYENLQGKKYLYPIYNSINLFSKAKSFIKNGKKVVAVESMEKINIEELQSMKEVINELQIEKYIKNGG